MKVGKFLIQYIVWGLAFLLLPLFLVSFIVLAPLSLPLQAHLTKNATKRLGILFPTCRIERKTVRIDSQKRKEIKQQARVSFVASRYIYFWVDCNKKSHFVALRDIHRVRTKRETLLVILNERQQVQGIEVIDFHEPMDYLPPLRWLRLFQGKGAKDPVLVGSDLAAISGATLTSYAVSSSVRRALALSQSGFFVP